MAMYLNDIWIKNGSVFVLEICIEIWKSNVFDLAELYLYLISKYVFEPNPDVVIQISNNKKNSVL